MSQLMLVSFDEFDLWIEQQSEGHEFDSEQREWLVKNKRNREPSI